LTTTEAPVDADDEPTRPPRPRRPGCGYRGQPAPRRVSDAVADDQRQRDLIEMAAASILADRAASRPAGES
jgi:hypothetical protein